METMNKEFTKIYKEYKPVVMTAIRLQVKNEMVAEDICQETFEKVFNHLKSYDALKGKFNTWIVTIAKNTITDHYRKYGEMSERLINVDDYANDSNNNNKRDTDNFFSDSSTSNKKIENQELKVKITKAFSTLKPRHKEIAIMYFKQKLQYTDIANVLEIPLNTVKVTIMRIREVLQSQLKKEYELINQ
jgi:RNA polymerase sigma-70 factor, ECF subfamily